MRYLHLIVTAALALAPCHGTAAQQNNILVFAAASLKEALDETNAAFTQAAGAKVTASYAASSQLVKQIEQGAPADIFISADVDWMDYGAQKQLINAATRVNLLGNRLVLIAPGDGKVERVTIGRDFPLAAQAGDGRIITGDVRAVPVGRYAKAALENLGLWDSIQQKLAMVENVRAALALVARGEAPIGIVYETDARVEPRVRVIGVFPAGSHPPIVYPAGLTMAAKPGAAEYLGFLQSAVAKAIFEKHGFEFLAKPGS